MDLCNEGLGLLTGDAHIVVDLHLVLLVDRWEGEGQQLSEDEEGDAVEDSSHVGHQPHGHGQLQRVHQVLHKEEAEQQPQRVVDVGHGSSGVALEGLGGQGDIELQVGPERMPLLRLLHSLDDRLVDAEADGDGEQGQHQVGHHADHAEGSQGQQQQQAGCKHSSAPPHVPPEDQVVHGAGRGPVPRAGRPGGLGWGRGGGNERGLSGRVGHGGGGASARSVRP